MRLESLLSDLRYATRTLFKTPGFALGAIAILGLGIGANAAMFSVVNAVVLRPLAFPDSHRLVRIWHVPPPQLFPGVTRFSVSPANFLDWRASADVFERVSIYSDRQANLTGHGDPEAVAAGVVDVDFFHVLGAAPILGRTFLAGEDVPGHDGVVVLSESLWRSRFGADPAIVGQSIQVDGMARTVVGVVPRSTDELSRTIRMWEPLAWSPEEQAVRGNHNYGVIARLKPGVTVDRAQAELTAISLRLAQQYPADDAGWGALVVPLQEDVLRDTRAALFLLLGAVGFVMLIACANTANLLLARTTGRSKEVAVRAALGAGRGRMIQHLLCEATLLGAAGGLAGLLLARASLGGLVALAARELPRAGDIALDGQVLAFTVLVALATGMLAGLVPAWRATSRNLHDALKTGLSRTIGITGERGVRRVLIVSEVALAFVLLVGAGLLIHTLAMLHGVDPGINPRNVLTMTVAIPPEKYKTPADRQRFFDEAIRRIRALPAVEATSMIDSLPTQGGSMQPVAIPGEPPRAMSEQPEVLVRRVMPDYLRASGTRLLEGRDFGDADTADRPAVALVSESFARRFWPNQDPLDQELTLTLLSDTVRRVVGVVGDVKLTGLDTQPGAAVYIPLAQVPGVRLSLLVRAAVPPALLTRSIASAIHAVDPELPLADVMTMDEVLGDSIARQRFAMELLAAFAALALLLAAVGIYSVLSYTVRQRVQEIGVRMALGAPIASVLRMVVVEGMKPMMAGIIIGIVAAMALGGVMSALVYGITPHDGATFVSVALIIMVVGAVASLVPAYRATCVDPLVALRDE